MNKIENLCHTTADIGSNAPSREEGDPQDQPGQRTTFSHAMLGEIFEQPRAIADTLAHYLARGSFVEERFAAARTWLNAHDEIVIAASGSSRHACLAAEIMFEDLSGIPVDVEYASEYACRSSRTHKNAALAVISQSGETGDTLSALHKGTESGRGTLAITNVAESSMAREASVSLLPALEWREPFLRPRALSPNWRCCIC